MASKVNPAVAELSLVGVGNPPDVEGPEYPVPADFIGSNRESAVDPVAGVGAFLQAKRVGDRSVPFIDHQRDRRDQRSRAVAIATAEMTAAIRSRFPTASPPLVPVTFLVPVMIDGFPAW